MLKKSYNPKGRDKELLEKECNKSAAKIRMLTERRGD